MFDWLFESKIQNVCKAVKKESDKIISALKNKPKNIKKKKELIDYFIQNDIKVSPQETDDTNIILIIIKDFWNCMVGHQFPG
jgi:dsDNA-specific endonuclease/ATPase MutS2